MWTVEVDGVFDTQVRRSDLVWYLGYVFPVTNPQSHLHLEVHDRFGRHGAYPHEWAVGELAPPFGRDHKAFMKKWYDWGSIVIRVTRTQNVMSGQLDASGRTVRQKYHPELLKRVQEARELARDLLKEMGAKRIGDITAPLPTEGSGGGSGGCRAGADRRTSVVNSDFECHDIDNLFICEGSVFPSLATFHNTGAHAAMLGCHAWRRIVTKHFSA
jgi:choline dehydrogenase-like flavoprotein